MAPSLLASHHLYESMPIVLRARCFLLPTVSPLLPLTQGRVIHCLLVCIPLPYKLNFP